MKFKKNVLLKNYTTFQIGGPAKYFYIAENKTELIRAIKMAKKLKLPFFVLGGGSNLLINDEGFKGLVIKIQSSKFKIQNYNSKCKIFCEAGTPLALVVSKAAKNNLTGLEWAVGIPGQLGGAIRGNAGALGNSMKDIIKEVEIFDAASARIKNYDLRDCKFDYRDSVFKKNSNLVILSAEIQLKKGNKEEIKKKIKENLKCRKESRPLNFPSAGSIFKNPKGYKSWKLIEKCNLKGKKIGRVQISKKHSGYIVNLGNAKARDVKKLINLIKRKVKSKFGVNLEEEIQYLGF